MMHRITLHPTNMSGGSAGIAFGPDNRLERGAAADKPEANYASPLNPRNAAFHSFRVGDLEIFQLFDGATSRELDQAIFKNVGVDEVSSSLEAAGFSKNRMPNSYTITIARIGGQLVMFDSGNGESGQPASGHLHRNMLLAGLSPTDISKIVITHFHPDHIFGLMSNAGEQIYPDVEILVPAAEYSFWTDPDCINQLPQSRVALARRIQATLPTWNNISQYDANKDVLPGIHAIPTYGHSPGHTSLLLSSGNAQLMVSGDVTNVPVLNMHHPHWHLAADHDPHLAAETRIRMLDRVAADGIVCTGYHWGMPGAGTIIRDGDGYALVPTAMD
ncbi:MULTISPECIES: MBL fold metallo-hydrolase [unclassified Sinorhizobium]|uniref:MBL fold metallo-hydrolase n=1 Tax=unclassified Sinorhizobium TaxID=2613772 RepID=UPI0035238D57